ncbi:MAG: patatin family protein [Bacilli bacterium]|nr:patatin family protein [Bacilli bacterium]
MKTCLVLEGGGLRGIYTAGVLDALYRENIKIDAIIGVSMGTIVGINYISKQPGRALRYNLKYAHDKRYIGINQYLKTGDIVNKKFAYHDIPEKLDKFDYHTYEKSNIKLYCTVTNVKTGKAEYKQIKNAKEQIEYLRAGASLPGVSKIVKINGKKYLDGGIADPIPVNKAISLGYDKIIVITTRPIDYRKRKTPINPLGLMYHMYPKFVVAINRRANKYNKTVEQIQQLEKENKIFVIRPSKKINIKRIEKNDRTITLQYNLGKEDFKNKKNDLIKYLKTE